MIEKFQSDLLETFVISFNGLSTRNERNRRKLSFMSMPVYGSILEGKVSFESYINSEGRLVIVDLF